MSEIRVTQGGRHGFGRSIVAAGCVLAALGALTSVAATEVTFYATNMSRPLEVVGDSGRSFDLTLEDVKLGLCPEAGSLPVIDLFCIHALRIRNLDLRGNCKTLLG